MADASLPIRGRPRLSDSERKRRTSEANKIYYQRKKREKLGKIGIGGEVARWDNLKLDVGATDDENLARILVNSYKEQIRLGDHYYMWKLLQEEWKVGDDQLAKILFICYHTVKECDLCWDKVLTEYQQWVTAEHSVENYMTRVPAYKHNAVKNTASTESACSFSVAPLNVDKTSNHAMSVGEAGGRMTKKADSLDSSCVQPNDVPDTCHVSDISPKPSSSVSASMPCDSKKCDVNIDSHLGNGPGRATLMTDNATVMADNEAVMTENAAVLTDKAAVMTDSAAVMTEDTAVMTDKAAVMTDSAAVMTENTAVMTDKAAVMSDSAAVMTKDTAVMTDEVAVMTCKKNRESGDKLTAENLKLAFEKQVTKDNRGSVADEDTHSQEVLKMDCIEASGSYDVLHDTCDSGNVQKDCSSATDVVRIKSEPTEADERLGNEVCDKIIGGVFGSGTGDFLYDSDFEDSDDFTFKDNKKEDPDFSCESEPQEQEECKEPKTVKKIRVKMKVDKKVTKKKVTKEGKIKRKRISKVWKEEPEKWYYLNDGRHSRCLKKFQPFLEVLFVDNDGHSFRKHKDNVLKEDHMKVAAGEENLRHNGGYEENMKIVEDELKSAFEDGSEDCVKEAQSSHEGGSEAHIKIQTEDHLNLNHEGEVESEKHLKVTAVEFKSSHASESDEHMKMTEDKLNLSHKGEVESNKRMKIGEDEFKSSQEGESEDHIKVTEDELNLNHEGEVESEKHLNVTEDEFKSSHEGESEDHMKITEDELNLDHKMKGAEDERKLSHSVQSEEGSTSECNLVRNKSVVYRCKVCSFATKSLPCLKKHVLYKELGSDELVMCQHCGKNVAKNGILLHERSHARASVKPHYFCSYEGCFYENQRRDKVNEHIDAVHLNCRKHPCTWEGCDKRFKSPHALKVHLRTHTGDKPIICYLCGYQCRQKASLNWHMKTKHPGV